MQDNFNGFNYTPVPKKEKLYLAYGIAGTVLLAGVLFRTADIAALLGEIMFIVGAAALTWLFLRYSFATYTYTLAEDRIFEVTRKDGRRLTVMASIRFDAVKSVEKTAFGNKPRKAFACYATFLPDDIIVMTVNIDGSEMPVLLEYNEEFFYVLQKAVML